MQNYNPALIRALNDALRQRHVGGRIVATNGVHARGLLFVASALDKIAGPLTFTADNDPYGEHDFGAVTVFDSLLFWKIDYLSPDLLSAAVDPADEAACCRVLTIMLAEEY